jgi:hypothetical protein
MITIAGKIITIDGKQAIDGPGRVLTNEESLTVTSYSVVGSNYVYYQGDEPEPLAEALHPNWNGLTQALSVSSLMSFALANANPNGFTLMLKTLTDGEINSASESFLLMAINACQLSFSTTQKDQLNQMLADNNFTIRVS